MDDYQVASNWWIGQMKLRCKELHPKKVTGDNSNLVIVDSSLEREFSRFQRVLFEEILFHVRNGLSLSLTCYYIPNRALTKLATKASINKIYLPIRAQMQIWGFIVEVSLDGEDLHKLPLSTK